MSNTSALERQVAAEQNDHDARFGNAPAGDTEVERKRENVDDTPDERDLETDERPDETEPGQQNDDDISAAATDGETLFDATDYEREDLQIPKVDGETIDKIRVKFSGSVMLDRSAPADVALYNRLQLGQDVELRCAGTVKGVGTGFTTNRDGDLDVVVGEKTVRVGTVWVLDPEQLR